MPTIFVQLSDPYLTKIASMIDQSTLVDWHDDHRVRQPGVNPGVAEIALRATPSTN
jgi:hypothetical protein